MAKLIVANWKMNPQSTKEAEEILVGYGNAFKNLKFKIKNCEVVACPPFTHLEKVKNLLPSEVKLGAQNVFWENSGAYTGEISPVMLKDLGCEYVIIGHSERRNHLGETDEIINKKIRAALAVSLKVILCVGEPLEIREKGKKAVEDFIGAQLENDLKNIKLPINVIEIAYEPIWAIGTGIPDTPENAAETIKFIKNTLSAISYQLSAQVLYGGSVNSKNAGDFLAQEIIDGLLVGGASLNADEFAKIIQSA